MESGSLFPFVEEENHTFMNDEIFIPDDDTSGEWLAQVFEVAALETLGEQMRHDEYHERSRPPAGVCRNHRAA
jgi:hypothetical protein